MPRKTYARRRRTTKKSYAKRSGMRRKRASPKFKSRYNSRPHGGFSSSPFPATLYKVLTYSDDIVPLGVTTAGLPAILDYRGNSMFDPDETGVGSQPKYFDTYCGATGGNAPYGRYNVMASKLVLDIMPDPTLPSAQNLMEVAILPLRGAAGTSPFQNITDMSERPYVKTRVIGNSNASAFTRMTYFCKTKQLFGGQNTNELDFSANYNANPASGNSWRWHIGLVNIQTGALSGAYIRARIKYYVQFTVLNQIATS